MSIATMESVNVQDQINIAMKEGRKVFKSVDCVEELLVTTEDFLLGKQPKLRYDEYYILESSDYRNGFVLVSPAGRLYQGTFRVDASSFFYTQLGAFIDLPVPPSAIIVQTSQKMLKANRLKRMVLVNADDDVESLVDEFSGMCVPATSFRCMQRFYEENEAFDRIADGKLVMVDFTRDSYKNLSVNDKKAIAFNKKPKPPEPGYSLLNNQRWHRSGTVLLQDRERNICILLGQDEGTYFGVQLPKMARTIPDAFTVLVPPEVGNQSYQRQGEWFMVPISEKKVPLLTECSAYSDDGIVLPIETGESNKHTINSREVRVGFDGYVYAVDPNVYHDEHQDISGNGWHVFYKNTAVRAFSEQGVD